MDLESEGGGEHLLAALMQGGSTCWGGGEGGEGGGSPWPNARSAPGEGGREGGREGEIGRSCTCTCTFPLHTHTHTQAFDAQEVREKEKSDAVLRKLDSRIKKADRESEVRTLISPNYCTPLKLPPPPPPPPPPPLPLPAPSLPPFLSPSQEVHKSLNQQLQQARAESNKIQELMGRMGISPRPTVSEWLEQKKG